jgi:hypothetical protein
MASTPSAQPVQQANGVPSRRDRPWLLPYVIYTSDACSREPTLNIPVEPPTAQLDLDILAQLDLEPIVILSSTRKDYRRRWCPEQPGIARKARCLARTEVLRSFEELV